MAVARQEQAVRRARERATKGIGLYLHIPFCQTKCAYCDFNTYAGLNHLVQDFVPALCRELRLWGEALGAVPVRSVFFGGGTPSLLTPEQISAVLDGVRTAFRLGEDAEVSAEVNPEDASVERLAGFRAAGINRLSMGVQTLDAGLLRVLTRRHSAERAVEAFRNARAAGFANLNLDLMYGLPLQTMDQWRATLERVVELRPDHLSAYCLTVEQGTPLHKSVRKGELPEPDADLAAEQYELAEAVMGEAGYRHYEISNWALRGKECSHNLIYWRNEEYLGVGPGAHSYLGGFRFATLLSPHAYLERLANAGGQPQLAAWDGVSRETLARIPTVADVEAIDVPLEMAETAMLVLRLDDGLRDAPFAERFGKGFMGCFGGVFEEMRAAGLVNITPGGGDGQVVLTARGRLLSNEVFRRLLTVRFGKK
ncbi:MAG: radical SAM family heme chaperone HemW [Dehalococcoidia bacterium]|nr:radical SAM family heme chaperone HemW [Dehalococcoidia bacterium]